MTAAKKTKLFQNAQTFYHWMGIYPPFFKENHSINRRNVSLFFGMIPMVCSTAGFFIFKNASAVDRAQAFHACLTHIACIVNFLSSFGKRANIFEYIDKFEKYIDKRTSNIEMEIGHTLNFITF